MPVKYLYQQYIYIYLLHRKVLFYCSLNVMTVCFSISNNPEQFVLILHLTAFRFVLNTVTSLHTWYCFKLSLIVNWYINVYSNLFCKFLYCVIYTANIYIDWLLIFLSCSYRNWSNLVQSCWQAAKTMIFSEIIKEMKDFNLS